MTTCSQAILNNANGSKPVYLCVSWNFRMCLVFIGFKSINSSFKQPAHTGDQLTNTFTSQVLLSSTHMWNKLQLTFSLWKRCMLMPFEQVSLSQPSSSGEPQLHGFVLFLLLLFCVFFYCAVRFWISKHIVGCEHLITLYVSI